MVGRHWAVGGALVVLSWHGAAPAQPAEEPPAAVAERSRAAAVELFRQGMALLRAGDVEHALDRLLRSRKLFPSKGNTLNAAICLERLGRLDEALGLYEEVVSVFGSALDAEDRAALPAVMQALRERVGTVDVAGNVDGAAVLVDGRERGRLPLTTPLRVLPGVRQVRVVKDGYGTWEGRVEVSQGRVSRIDARLAPLQSSGGLRVEADGLGGGAVTVDGVEVGQVPWEGTLAPGAHLVSVRSDERGSRPTEVMVLAGQTALVRMTVGELAPPLRVQTSPESAEVLLDGVAVGRGLWAAALPVGTYTLTAREAGYRRRSVTVALARGRVPAPIRLALEVDPEHPRWPAHDRGSFLVGASAGGTLARSLGSEAEESCPGACSRSEPAWGTVLWIGAAWELPSRLAFGAQLGHISLRRAFRRELAGTVLDAPDGSSAALTYSLDDALRLRGTALAATAGYSHPLSAGVYFRSRVAAGAWFTRAVDTITGTASTRTSAGPVSMSGVNSEVSSVQPLLSQEIGAYYDLDGWRLGGSLAGLLSFPFSFRHAGAEAAPALERGPLVVNAPCPATAPTSAGCAPESALVSSERAFGAFFSLALLASVEVAP